MSRPKVLVVGDPRLADMLSAAGAQWTVQPAAANVNAMWDAIEAGTLTNDAVAAFFSDGTGTSPDELESTLAAFAPFATVFVVATPERAQAIIARAHQIASAVPNGDPAATIHALPVHDVQAAYAYIQAALGGAVQWDAPVVPPATTSAPPVPAPAPAAPPASTPPPAPVPAAPATSGYEQGQVYAPNVVAAASRSIPKPPGARPGQLTIASMSSKGGSGKCLHGDSVVIDPKTGVPYPLRSIVEHDIVTSVAAYAAGSIAAHPIAARMHSGTKNTYVLTLASGRSVTATGNHPMLSRAGWKPLEEVEIGEALATPASHPLPENPLALAATDVDLLAYFTAETTAHKADLPHADSAIFDIVALAARAHIGDTDLGFLGLNPITASNPTQRAIDASRVSIHARHGLTEAAFPLAAYRLDRPTLTRFLSLYWMAAGHVTVNQEAYVCVETQSAAAALQHLLLRLGIQTFQTFRTGPRNTWKVSVHPDYIKNFAETLAIWGVKADNLASITTPLAPTTALHWDEVVSIVEGPRAEVYDIEVPGPANFVANDIVVHNSTTAALLAGTIAKSSAAAGKPLKVVLVDLDTRDGQVGSLIGKYMPTSINIRVMPEWNADTVTANLVHDPRLGIDALLAPVRPRNADDVGADFYRQIIGILQTTHDVVVLDCSVNYLDPLLGTAFAMSDEILFVTTLATTSVQGMARSLTELFADPADGGLGIPKEKVGIVANQVIKNVGMGKDKLLRAALGAPLVGQIPSDQDAVLVATNSNRMADLLKHPRLGPAYFRLAVNCMPHTQLTPITTEQVAAAKEQQAEVAQKRGLFRK